MIKRTLLIVLILLLAMSVSAQEANPVTVIDAYGNEVTIEDTSRIVTIGGAVTETVYALGFSENIVGVDESSIYPAEALELPIIGYLRYLAAEPILEVEPTLIITTQDAGPQEVVDLLESAGITFLVVPAEDTVDGAITKIRTIAQALDSVELGETLIADLQADIETATTLTDSLDSSPRVLFLFLRGQAVQGLAGTGTGADEMIRLAGAENAFPDADGYQALTAEAVITAQPDIIVTTSNGIDSIGGMDALLALPGVSDTPAAQNGRIIASMDDMYLLGFTSRLGDAVLDFTYLLHEDLPRSVTTVARLDGRFDTLIEAIEIAEYQALFEGEGPYTIFAPAPTAFDALPPALLEGLFSSPISVQAVIGFHVVEGNYTAEQLMTMDGQQLPTLLGAPLMITVDGDTLLVNGVTITEPDITADNGILHMIDGVLMPERP